MKESSPYKLGFLSNLFVFKVARGVGDAVQRMPYTDHELSISLNNSLKLHDHEVQQSKSFLGNLTTLFGKPLADPDKIEIDGMRVMQLYDLAYAEPPIPVEISKSYFMNVETVRSMLQAIAENQKKMSEDLSNRTPWDKAPQES